jgi:hypothetical protein
MYLHLLDLVHFFGFLFSASMRLYILGSAPKTFLDAFGRELKEQAFGEARAFELYYAQLDAFSKHVVADAICPRENESVR